MKELEGLFFFICRHLLIIIPSRNPWPSLHFHC